MQILHTSDTHLGCAQFNYQERERDVYQAFEEVIDTAVKERVDAVVHGGDVFHVPKPGGQPLLRFAEGIKRLAENDIRFYFTLGDHDIAGITGTPSSYLFHRLGLATFVGDGRPVYLRKSSSEELMVLGFHKRRRGEINDQFAEEMKRADDLARSHEGKKVIVLHQGLYEFNKWAGEITVNDLPRSFDYYALGHLHDHDERRFEGFSGPLCYPGSIDPVPPERIQEYEKGFYIVDLSGEEARPDWIKIRCSRPQFRFEVDYPDVVRRLEEIRTDLKAKGLAKAPVVHLDVRGRGVDGARLTSALAGLISSCLYCDWEVVDDASGAGEGSLLQERPEDVNEELLRFATRALGSEETASFALKELLPLLQGGKRDEAAELVLRAFEASRPLPGPPPADTRPDAPGAKSASPTGGALAADDATAGGRTTRRRRSSGP